MSTGGCKPHKCASEFAHSFLSTRIAIPHCGRLCQLAQSASYPVGPLPLVQICSSCLSGVLWCWDSQYLTWGLRERVSWQLVVMGGSRRRFTRRLRVRLPFLVVWCSWEVEHLADGSAYTIFCCSAFASSLRQRLASGPILFHLKSVPRSSANAFSGSCRLAAFSQSLVLMTHFVQVPPLVRNKLLCLVLRCSYVSSLRFSSNHSTW